MARAVFGILGLVAACATSNGIAHNDVTFTAYSALSRNDEIARRTLTPLTYRQLHETLAARHDALVNQTIDLAHERFDLYIPGGPPPARGYGLLVYIAPWDDPTQPQRWRGPLDRHDLVFVAARRSGNTQNVLDRRLPLAVLAAENVRAMLPIDPARTYVMGLSGGSRVAEIAAMAFPELFRGAVLNAGADPIDGKFGMYKSPSEVFHAFQRSRLVFITGDADEDNRKQEDLAVRSLRAACVLDLRTEVALGLGHEALDQRSLETALDTLDQPSKLDDRELASCNAGVALELEDQLRAAAQAIARGARDQARALLKAIDARYGGLAAPKILELDARLRALIPRTPG